MARNDSELLKEAKKIQAEKIELQKKSIALTEDEQKQLEFLISKQKELRKEFQELRQEKLDSYKNEESSIKSMGSLYNSLSESQKQTISEASKKGKFDKDQITSIVKIQEINRSIAQLGNDDVEARVALTNEYNDQISSLGESLHGNTKVIQQLKSQNTLANEYSNISSEQKELIQKQHDILDGISKTIRGTLMTATTLYGNLQGAIGGIISGMGFVADKIGDVNKQLGTTLFQSDGVGRKAGVLSFIFEDAAGTAKNLSAELGSTDRATFGLQTNVGLMAMNMGISNGEAATLVGSFTRLNGNSTSVATDMVATSREFAKQNGIIPAQLMADLANSAEEFALFGKQGGKNIIEAAGFAAKLGVNMKSISGISENLLDFESSITKELELGAMLGRNINLNKARELAFTGDIEGAAKETLKALGGQQAFEQMNYYQRKQTADLLGVSVSELQKMVANEQQAATLGGVISKNFNQAGEFLNAGLNKYLGTSLKAMGGMITAGAQLGANFTQMGGSFEPITKGIKNIGAKLGGASKVTDSVSDVGKKASQSTDIASKTPTKSDGGLKGLAKGLRSMGDPKVLFGALNLIPTALGMVAILPGIPGMLALSVLGGPAGMGLKLLGNGLKSFGNVVSKALPQIGLGLLVLAGFGAAMIPLAYSLSIAAPAISAFGDVIKSAFEGIASVVTAVSNGLVSMLSVITLEKAAAMVVMGSGFGLMAIGIGSLAIAAALGGRTVTRFIGRIAESASLLGGGAAQGLQTTAQALMSMGSGLSMINEQLDRLNPEKLEALSDFSMSLSIGGALTSVGNAVGGLVDSVSALIGGGEEEGSLSQYETDALKYLERIAVATEKGATIKGRDRSAFNPMGINNN